MIIIKIQTDFGYEEVKYYKREQRKKKRQLEKNKSRHKHEYLELEPITEVVNRKGYFDMVKMKCIICGNTTYDIVERL